MEMSDPLPLDNGQHRSAARYRLVSHVLDSTLVIPALSIEIWPPESSASPALAITDAIAVRVGSRIPTEDLESAEARPERPPVALPTPTPWGKLLAVAAVTALLAWLLWRLWRRRQNRDALESVFVAFEPPRPAHELALEELDALEASEVARSGPAKQFFTEASDILRRYVDRRFLVDAPDQTSDEVLHALEGAELPGRTRSLVRNLLREADLVKFARLDPPWSEWASTLDHGREIVRSTIPPAPAETPLDSLNGAPGRAGDRAESAGAGDRSTEAGDA